MIKKLGDVLDIQNGYAFDSKLFSNEGGMPLIRIRDIKNGVGTQTRYTGEYDNKYVVKKGDLLIGMDGEFGCYEWKDGEALLNQRVCRLQNFQNNIFPKFLLYGINSYLKAIEDVTGYTTVKHISSKQIANIDFPLPSIEIQQKIVTKLDAIFAEIDKATAVAEANAKNAEALFQSYLTEVFERGGEGWLTKRVSELVADKLILKPFDGNHGEIHPVAADYTDFGVPFIMASDLKDGVVDLINSKFLPKSITDKLRVGFAKNNDILITHKGTIGRVAKLITDMDYVMLTPQVTSYRVINEDILSRDFLFHYFQSNFLQDQLYEMAKGGSTRAYAGITKQNSLIIKVPPISIQNELIYIFEKMETLKKSLLNSFSEKIRLLPILKHSILQKAFNGELVKD